MHTYFLGQLQLFRVSKLRCGQQFSAHNPERALASLTFYRKCLDFSDLLLVLLTVSGCTSTFPSPSNISPKSPPFEKNADSTKPHTMKAPKQILIGRSARHLWLWRKINHANQLSHSRVPFPPLGSVSKHNSVATVILMVNTANQVNHTDIYLVYFFSCKSDTCLRLFTRPIHDASARANSGANMAQ